MSGPLPLRWYEASVFGCIEFLERTSGSYFLPINHVLSWTIHLGHGRSEDCGAVLARNLR